ncbi:hypothetical protein P4O66_008010, partial [Electrophorus voltai]
MDIYFKSLLHSQLLHTQEGSSVSHVKKQPTITSAIAGHPTSTAPRVLASDSFAPAESKYCYTRHVLDGDEASISVTKRCATLQDCLTTGCMDMEHEGNR